MVSTGKFSRRGKVKLIASLVFVLHLLGIAAAVDAIMSVRTSRGAVAWSVSLVTFPYVALPAYLLFGRSKFKGYLHDREKVVVELEKVIGDVRDKVEPYRIDRQDRDEPVYTGMVRLGGLSAMRANKLELLVDGEATFDSILEGIRSARKQILFQFYIIHDDELGREVKDALVARAREGIKVYVLYDEIGSLGLSSEYVGELKAAGIQVAAFNTTKGHGNRFQLNFRNHRKIVVVDSRSGWIGGHNVGDEYLGRNPEIGPWRDTHVRIDGPAAIQAQIVVAADWYWATNRLPELEWSVHPVEGQGANAMVYPSDPASEHEAAELLFMQVITLARKRLWISSPYFVPDEGIISALQIAVLRGVDVRLIIAGKSDNVLVDLAAWSFLPELIKSGVKVYHYNGGFLHQKVFLLDDRAVGIGTKNFDNRSFRLNFEVTLIASDPELTAEVKAMLEQDMVKSRPVEPGDYEAKPFWFPLATRFSRLLAPVL